MPFLLLVKEVHRQYQTMHTSYRNWRSKKLAKQSYRRVKTCFQRRRSEEIVRGRKSRMQTCKHYSWRNWGMDIEWLRTMRQLCMLCWCLRRSRSFTMTKGLTQSCSSMSFRQGITSRMMRSWDRTHSPHKVSWHKTLKTLSLRTITREYLWYACAALVRPQSVWRTSNLRVSS